MTSKPIERVDRLAYAAPEQRGAMVGGFAFGTLLAAAEVLLFDWSVRETVLGGLIGACVWGVATYLWSTSELAPRGALQEAPPEIELEAGGFELWSRSGLIFAGAALVPFAWLVDRLDGGAVIIPGQPWGWAAAAAVVLVRISRWERAHSRRVVYDPDADKPRPYAGPPL